MFTVSLSGGAPLATQRPICLIFEMDGFSVDTIFWPVKSRGFSFPPFPSSSRWSKSLKHGSTGTADQTDEVSGEMGKYFGMQVQIIPGINNVHQLLQTNYWIIENARVL